METSFRSFTVDSTENSTVFQPHSPCREEQEAVANTTGAARTHQHQQQQQQQQPALTSVNITAIPSRQTQPVVAAKSSSEPHARKPQAAAASTTVQVRERHHRDPNSNNINGGGGLASTEEEKPVVAAEDEGWGTWTFRKVYNGLIMLGISMYQTMQAGWRHEQVDMKVIDFTNEQYIPNPPTRAQLAAQRAEKRAKLGLPAEPSEGRDSKNPLDV